MTLAGEKTAYRNSHKLAKHQKVVSFDVGPYPDVSRLTPDEALKSITGWIDNIKRQAMSLEMYDVEIVETTDPWVERCYRDWSVIGTVNKTPEEIAKDKAKAARRAAAAEKRAASKLAQEEPLATDAWFVRVRLLDLERVRLRELHKLLGWRGSTLEQQRHW